MTVYIIIMSFNLNVILDKEDDVKVEKFSLDKGNYNEMRNLCLNLIGRF